VQKKSLDFSDAPAKRMAEGAQIDAGMLNQSSFIKGVNASDSDRSPLLSGEKPADENN